MTLEVLLTPAEIARLSERTDLRGEATTTCVVFDVLRATTTILTALGVGGARAVWPAATIEEARQLRERLGPDNPALLGGERGGRPPTGFDLGNSPREYTDPASVSGRDIVLTTTNGTVALRACAEATAGTGEILVGALSNLRAVADHLRRRRPERLLLVCAGTHAGFAYEDALGAGALLAELDDLFPGGEDGGNGGGAALPDAARAVLQLYRVAASDLSAALRASDNGRRLENIGLGADVPVCAARDKLEVVPTLGPDGAVRV